MVCYWTIGKEIQKVSSSYFAYTATFIINIHKATISEVKALFLISYYGTYSFAIKL